MINNVDPIGLIAGGAPGDEYHMEAEIIVANLNKITDSREIYKVVKNIFDKNFGKDTNRDNRYILLAQKLWQLNNFCA